MAFYELINRDRGGGIGGLVGATVMLFVMFVGKQLGYVRTPVPNKIVRSLKSKMDLIETTVPADETILGQGIHSLIILFLLPA